MLKRKFETNIEAGGNSKEQNQDCKESAPEPSTSYLLLLPHYGNGGNRGKESWTLTDVDALKTTMRKCVKEHWRTEWKLQMSELVNSVQIVNYDDGGTDRCARYAVVLMFAVGNREVLLVFDEYNNASWKFITAGKVETRVEGNENTRLQLKELHSMRNYLCPAIPFNLFYTVFYETFNPQNGFKLYNFHANCEVSWRSVNCGKFSAALCGDLLDLELTDEELNATNENYKFKLPTNQVFIFPEHFNKEVLEAEYPWMSKRMRAGEWFEYGHRSEILCLDGIIEDQPAKAIKNTVIIRQQQMCRIISAMFVNRSSKIEEALAVVKGLSLYKDKWKFEESFYGTNSVAKIATSTGTFASNAFFLSHSLAPRDSFQFRLSWPIRSNSVGDSNVTNATTCSLEEHRRGEAKEFLPKLKLEEWELTQLVEWFFCCTYEIEKLQTTKV